MTHQPTKLLVEAGIIPKNTLQQLVNWRLLPEDSVESHGVHPIRLDASNQKEVQRFVKDLSTAITKDMAEIRETELDHSGSYKRARVEFSDSRFNCDDCDIFVDRLGRLVLPSKGPWDGITRVLLEGDNTLRNVVKREPRYEGEKVIALVVYLDAEGGNHASVV